MWYDLYVLLINLYVLLYVMTMFWWEYVPATGHIDRHIVISSHIDLMNNHEKDPNDITEIPCITIKQKKIVTSTWNMKPFGGCYLLRMAFCGNHFPNISSTYPYHTQITDRTPTGRIRQYVVFCFVFIWLWRWLWWYDRGENNNPIKSLILTKR